MKNPFYDDFCEKIISLDKTIRFIGSANESGVMLAHASRIGLTPLLPTEGKIERRFYCQTRQDWIVINQASKINQSLNPI